MSVLSECWGFVTKPASRWRLWPTVCRELSTLVLLAPLLQSDLRMGFSPLVTCSDASEKGGAVAISAELASPGIDLTNRLSTAGLEPLEAEILIISAFNGIGGGFRGYDLQGIRAAHLIAIESDPGARRTTRAKCRT